MLAKLSWLPWQPATILPYVSLTIFLFLLEINHYFSQSGSSIVQSADCSLVRTANRGAGGGINRGTRDGICCKMSRKNERKRKWLQSALLVARVIKWISESVSHWVNQTVSHWVNESVSEWLTYWFTNRHTVLRRQSVTRESVNESLVEPVGQSIS